MRALYAVITQGKIGETYNIGGFNERSNLEVFYKICDTLDQLHPLQLDQASTSGRNLSYAPNRTKSMVLVIPEEQSEKASYRNLVIFVADRPGHDRRYVFDANKIKQDVGWSPQETFETGLYIVVAILVRM